MKLLISFLTSFLWVYTLQYDVAYQPRLGHKWYVYKLVMLTNLNFVLDTIYSVFLVYTTMRRTRCRMTPIMDFVYFTSIFPIAVVTCLLFWGLYFINPDLVMPEWIAKLIPSWLNHMTHTFPLVFVLMDSFLNKRRPPTKKTLFLMSVFLVSLYFLVIFYTRFVDGYWLYPLLGLLSPIHFTFVFLGSIIGFYMITLFGKCINRLFWGTKLKGQ